MANNGEVPIEVGIIPWEVLRRDQIITMTERERNIITGTVMGDAFLQMTGVHNARLRLEHSAKQKEYIFWKWQELKRYMQDHPKRIDRWNPIWKKQYAYYRCQSHSSSALGKLRAIFYTDHTKRIPSTIAKLLTPLALAVWFMDDGHYERHNKIAYLDLANLTGTDLQLLAQVLASKWGLHPTLERKKLGMDYRFSVADTRKLIKVIAPHVILSMRYKIGEEPRID